VIQTLQQPLLGGVTLECRACGQPGAPKVLLLHGFPEAAFVWDEVMAELAGRAQCLAPNLRGYAGSSAPLEVAAYRARHLVGDVVQLIEGRGAPIDLLVAHDWGGALAWNLAAARPDLLRRLLIINAPHPATFLRELQGSPAQQVASRYMLDLCEPGAEATLAADDFARLWPFLGQGAWLTPALRERYRQVWQLGLTGPLNYYRASPLRPPRSASDPLHALGLPDEVTRVAVPTRVLWGERDHALLPGLLEGLEQWVPNASVRRVPDASHWIVHERPDLVVQEVLAALPG
jgi:pimeloyl-ACP methyl ester carboxylesterase